MSSRPLLDPQGQSATSYISTAIESPSSSYPFDASEGTEASASKEPLELRPRSDGAGEERPTQRGRCAAWLSAPCPGLMLAGLVMLAGYALSDELGYLLLQAQGISDSGATSPISGIAVAILLGIVLNNLPCRRLSLPTPIFGPGFKFSKDTLLKAGIVLVGFKLSFLELVELGAVGVPLVALTIVTGLLTVPRLGACLRVPVRISLLIAAGSSICGVTAITAVAPVIGASKDEVSFASTSLCLFPVVVYVCGQVAFAVANVVLFGTLSMLTYPYLFHALLDSPKQIGTMLGLCIHDTAQVTGAAVTYSEVHPGERGQTVLKAAVLTKLTRNLFLTLVIPFIAWLHARQQAAQKPNEGGTSDSEILVEGIFGEGREQEQNDQGAEVKEDGWRLKGQEEEEEEGDRKEKEEEEEAMGVLERREVQAASRQEHSAVPPAAPPQRCGGCRRAWSTLLGYLPAFVLGFLVASLIRSLGDAMLQNSKKALFIFNESEWTNVMRVLADEVGGKYLLGTAMAAVGLSTSAASLRGVGARPFLLGFSALLMVGLAGFCLTLSAGALEFL